MSSVLSSNVQWYIHGKKLSNISWFRGDSFPLELILINNVTGNPVDITGCSFLLTINSELNPTGVTGEIFSIDAILDTDPTTGKVSFTPSATNTDTSPGVYFFDIQGSDIDKNVRTIVKGKFKIIQDITKQVSSVTEYSSIFTNDDLVSNILTVNHNLSDSFPVATIYNNVGQEVEFAITSIDEDSISVDFGGVIDGSWFITIKTESDEKKIDIDFNNSNLVAGVLTVNHSLNKEYPLVSVYIDNIMVSATVTSTGNSSFTVDFGGGISGEGHVTAL